MTELFASALKIQRALDASGTRNCFIGGLAVLRWGKPRPTKASCGQRNAKWAGWPAVLRPKRGWGR